jgi:hypothetical protein
MIDLPDSLQDTHFRKSILGSRLKAWSVLPDNPNVHSIWSQYPAQATYQWFQSLQYLLDIMQAWIKWLRFHPAKGFLEAHDTTGTNHLLIANDVPSPIPDRNDSLLQVLQQYDLAFQTRWYLHTSFDSGWASPVPAAHCQSVPAQPLLSSLSLATEPGGKKRRTALAGANDSVPDFINRTPLVEAVVPFNHNKPLAQQLLSRLTRAQFPKFPSANGELTMCFLSAFSAPHNCCVLSKCVDRRRQPRLHVDIGQERWKNKGESFWDPLVKFLKDPAVSQHLRPAPALRNATPSARWT